MIKSEQKFKTFIFKMKEENVEFKEKTWQMKSHAEKLKELRKMAKDQEFIERKWIETLFYYK